MKNRESGRYFGLYCHYTFLEKSMAGGRKPQENKAELREQAAGEGLLTPNMG